jgi:hypothetical protein
MRINLRKDVEDEKWESFLDRFFGVVSGGRNRYRYGGGGLLLFRRSVSPMEG